MLMYCSKMKQSESEIRHDFSTIDWSAQKQDPILKLRGCFMLDITSLSEGL